MRVSDRLFSWWNRTRRRRAFVIGFGKAPGWPEYLRFGAKHSPARELELWIDKAAQYGEAHRANAWSGFASRRHVSFLLRSSDGSHVFTGVIVPSKDAVGRRFPMAVAAMVPARDLSPMAHVAPLAFSGFLARASRALVLATAVSTPQELDNVLSSLEPPDLSDICRLAEEYDRWTWQQPLISHLETLTRDADARAILHTILEATMPFRGREAPPTALSIRLPLAKPKNISLSFWLHVVRSACQWRETVPGYFASANSALVQLGGTDAASALADIWLPQAESESVCTTTDTSKYGTPLPQDVGKLLVSNDATVGDLLTALGVPTRQVQHEKDTFP